MKGLVGWLAVSTVLICPPLLAGTGGNQHGGPQTTLTAVIDINHIFAKHSRFQKQMEQLKSDVQAFEADVNAQRRSMVEERKKLEMYQPQSREYKQIEESITRQASDIQVRAQLKRKEIAEREARHYYEAYTQIQSAVRQIADAHQIGLVLRFDSAEIDPQDRDSVIKGVSQSVVFQRNLDITPLVLQQINGAPAGQF
jgi:Skp family chaperone for outer membrane proteins